MEKGQFTDYVNAIQEAELAIISREDVLEKREKEFSALSEEQLNLLGAKINMNANILASEIFGKATECGQEDLDSAKLKVQGIGKINIMRETDNLEDGNMYYVYPDQNDVEHFGVDSSGYYAAVSCLAHTLPEGQRKFTPMDIAVLEDSHSSLRSISEACGINTQADIV